MKKKYFEVFIIKEFGKSMWYRGFHGTGESAKQIEKKKSCNTF